MTYLYDNYKAVKNMSIPELVLHKKHNRINYYYVSEAVTVDILRVGKDNEENNLAGLLTKVMAGQKHWDLFYYIFL